MPSFVLRDKTGRTLDRVEAASREDAFRIYKAKKPNVPARNAANEPSLLHRAWDAATTSFLPEYHFKTGNQYADRIGDFAYENLVRSTASPLGIASSAAWFARPAGLAFKAIGRGLRTPVNAIPTTGKGRVLSRLVDETKSLALTTGIPGTNVSFHGVSMGAANALGTPLREGGVIKGALKSARMLLDQKYVQKELAKIGSEQAQILGKPWTKTVMQAGRRVKVPVTWEEAAKKAGVTMDIGQQAGVRTLQPLVTQGKYNPLRLLRNVQEEVFDKPLFGEMVPLMKLQQFKRNFQFLEKTIKPPNKKAYGDIAREAAESANYFFGGLGKNAKWNKEALKPILLAPDWYERHFRMGGKIVSSIRNPTNPMGAAYRTFATNMLGTLGVMNVANRLLSGHNLWENQGGKFFQIDTGKLDENGRRMYIDPTAGSMDFAKVPVDVIHSMVKEKDMTAAIQPVLNRLSTVARAVTDMAGLNYKPRISRYTFPKRVRQPDGSLKTEYGPPRKKQLQFIAEDIIDNMSPGWFQAAEDAIHKGERDPLTSKAQIITKSLEIPMRFSKDKRPEVISRGEAKQAARERAKERKLKKRTEKRSGGS